MCDTDDPPMRAADDPWMRAADDPACVPQMTLLSSQGEGISLTHPYFAATCLGPARQSVRPRPTQLEPLHGCNSARALCSSRRFARAAAWGTGVGYRVGGVCVLCVFLGFNQLKVPATAVMGRKSEEWFSKRMNEDGMVVEPGFLIFLEGHGPSCKEES